jgi:hypothetical protein
MSNSLEQLPNDLIVAIRQVYEPVGLKITHVLHEIESSEYGAFRFSLNDCQVVFRIAKTTPTKIGQFVTLWKRPHNVIVPFEVNDDIDFVIISVSDTENHGQFIFGKDILLEKGILSQGDKKGKLAFRVYPPWTKPSAKDAIKSQQWQVGYFLPISGDKKTKPSNVFKLLSI